MSAWTGSTAIHIFSLELPPAPGSDLPYTPAGERADLDIAGLASVVRDHLRIPASRPAG